MSFGRVSSCASQVDYGQRQRPNKRRKGPAGKGVKGGRTWIMKKKELRRKRGSLNVPRDSKYTGRKRKGTF